MCGHVLRLAVGATIPCIADAALPIAPAVARAVVGAGNLNIVAGRASVATIAHTCWASKADGLAAAVPRAMERARGRRRV